MVSLLRNLSFGEHNDIVRVLNRGETVSHDEHRSDVSHLLQGILNQKLGLRVDVGRGLVEDHDLRLMDDRPGKGKKLPLAGGEIISSLPHFLIQPVFQPVDKMIRIDVTADLLDPLVGNTLLPKENVTPDCA